jgi:hypothetical protein
LGPFLLSDNRHFWYFDAVRGLPTHQLAASSMLFGCQCRFKPGPDQPRRCKGKLSIFH